MECCPAPDAATQVQSMILPTPCFTYGIQLLFLNAVIYFLQKLGEMLLILTKMFVKHNVFSNCPLACPYDL